jgi:magnesium and cobalt transporter
MFVPQSTPLDRLMITLQSRKRRAACVVDEFGGTAGIVTQGDVMEEIMEESRRGSVSRVGIESAGDGRWRVGGDTSLDEINAELGLHLTAENATRIGGWTSERLERIPRRGDTIRQPDCRVTIRAVRNRRVTSVILERHHRVPTP